MTVASAPGAILRHAELRLPVLAEQIMSMPAIHRRRWTLADVERLMDEREEGLSTPRYELVDGELLVTPAPGGRHQRTILYLAYLLPPYLLRESLGEVRLGPGELKLVAGEHYAPDLFVVPAIDGRLPEDDDRLLQPLLVCETLSPGSSRHDRITKRRAFQRQSVPEYWVIDGDAQAFEVWHPGDERAALVDDHLIWKPTRASTPFELDVRLFFATLENRAPLPLPTPP